MQVKKDAKVKKAQVSPPPDYTSSKKERKQVCTRDERHKLPFTVVPITESAIGRNLQPL